MYQVRDESKVQVHKQASQASPTTMPSRTTNRNHLSPWQWPFGCCQKHQHRQVHKRSAPWASSPGSLQLMHLGTQGESLSCCLGGLQEHVIALPKISRNL